MRKVSELRTGETISRPCPESAICWTPSCVPAPGPSRRPCCHTDKTLFWRRLSQMAFVAWNQKSSPCTHDLRDVTRLFSKAENMDAALWVQGRVWRGLFVGGEEAGGDPHSALEQPGDICAPGQLSWGRSGSQQSPARGAWAGHLLMLLVGLAK